MSLSLIFIYFIVLPNTVYRLEGDRAMSQKTLTILLTIIAGNLTIQTLQNIQAFPKAYAQTAVQKIAICGESGISCADITSFGELQITQD